LLQHFPVSTTVPLRIDSDLVHQARSAGALFDRPPTAQIEHWAKLGRVLDSVLSGKSVANVKARARISSIEKIVALSQSKAGQAKARAIIARHGGPIYGTDPATPGLIVERHPDGSIRRGRFVNRRFVAE
jgi:ParD-like antitoxin of type II bacterial toxin-antitoxin system